MQLKNSTLLLTALTAGSAVARIHGHERRHAALHNVHEEKRDVGDIVTATIDGKVVTWVNQYDGGAAATATNDAAPATTNVAETTATSTSTDSSSDDDNTPVSSAPGTCTKWDDVSDSFSRDGFGEKTLSNLLEYIWYKGNVGNPWGSNIIEVAADKACNYKYVVQLQGAERDPWTVVFWNKFGPDGKLTGWYGNSALKLSLAPGETKYVAFDEDTQGAWGAAKGDELPVDQYGGYSSTWGEFDFGNQGNNGWSGWDVSAIQAQAAGFDVQGMKICDNKGDGCSFITNLATKMVNAYSKAQEGVDGIGGNCGAGPVRLVVDIDYNE
ncbi:allergen Asp F4 [Aspergillus lucknowensis]|uniref:Allergen Asp f 4 n=1 Tax=Aspergillus lucknowensis TaxID=176173 RepID=A0ABR4LHZ8_9EURO